MAFYEEIHTRDFKFDFRGTPKHWLNDDLYLTHMFNAPSLISPYIEGLMNSIVLDAMNKLQNESMTVASDNFVKQETMHSREHIKYNTMLRKHGYHCDDVIAKIRNKFSRIKKSWSLLSLLALAVCFECLTTMISQVVLEEKILETADKRIKHFWHWHMMEELEHKSVLMNLYRELGGGYARRTVIFGMVMAGYSFYLLKIYLNLLKLDKASIFKGIRCVLQKKSFLRKSLVKSLRFYRYGYHPDNIHTDHLLDFESINLLPK